MLVAEYEAKLPGNWERKGRQSRVFSFGPKQCHDASQKRVTALLDQDKRSNLSAPGIMGMAAEHESLHKVFNTYFAPVAEPTPSDPNALPCQGVQPLPPPAIAAETAPAAAPASQHQVGLWIKVMASSWTNQSRHSTCMLGCLLETVHLRCVALPMNVNLTLIPICTSSARHQVRHLQQRHQSHPLHHLLAQTR